MCMIEDSIFKKYFIVDTLGLAHPMYAADERIPCVWLGEDFKIRAAKGRKRYMLPRCDFSKFDLKIRKEKFEEFAIDLLIESARQNQNFFDSFKEVMDHYITYDLSFGRILVPSGGEIFEKVSKYAILSNFESIDKTDLLTDIAIFCPPPEFVGVIAIESDLTPDPGKHSIAVINSRSICVLR